LRLRGTQLQGEGEDVLRCVQHWLVCCITHRIVTEGKVCDEACVLRQPCATCGQTGHAPDILWLQPHDVWHNQPAVAKGLLNCLLHGAAAAE
jgi:hypothetical protein